MNIKETVLAACKLNDIIDARADQKLYAEKHLYNSFNLDRIAYQEDGVYVTLEENTRHDCRDYENVFLSIEELEMTDEQWVKHIEEIKQERVKKEEEKERQKKEDDLIEQERLIKYHQDKLKELQGK